MSNRTELNLNLDQINLEEGSVLLVDKPINWTSFQVVNKIKWMLKKQLNLKKIKIGHAGTLDPLATGLLVICIGKKTKTISDIQAMKKEYTGTITFGATTPSFDLELPFDKTYPTSHLTKELIAHQTKNFIGEINQTPPVYSALKKDGKPLYKYARENKQVEIKPRKTIIYDFKITAYELPKIYFKVVCSKGTYIRSLAHDLGSALDCGSHLSSLRRTKIGFYNVECAKK